MTELRFKTLNGVFWGLISRSGQQFIAFFTSIALARMLSPKEFGLIGLVTVFAGFASIYGELGFGASLIQRQKISDSHLSSVFWLNCAAGVTLTLLFIFSAPLLAAFFDEPLLTYVAFALSFNFLINSFSIVQKALLTKKINFKTIAKAQVISSGIAGISAIVMAYFGWGVWSLVAQSILSAGVMAGLLWTFSSWRPQMIFDWKAIRDLTGFSLNYLGTQSLNYWVRNLDKLLIGRFIGTAPLGLYSMAYRILLFPLRNFSGVIANVLFPALSTIQDDKARVGKIYLKITRIIALVTFPAMTGLFAVAQPFVVGIFGKNWESMTGILRIFCLLGITQSIIVLNGTLFLSQGRADMQFRVGIILRLNLILGVVVGLNWGVMGVAIGYAVSSFINVYPNIYFAYRLVNLTFRDLARNLSGVFWASISMSLLVGILGLLIPDEWSALAHLTIQIFAGIGVYFGILSVCRISAYGEILEMIKDQIHSSRLKAPERKYTL